AGSGSTDERSGVHLVLSRGAVPIADRTVLARRALRHVERAAWQAAAGCGQRCTPSARGVRAGGWAPDHAHRFHPGAVGETREPGAGTGRRRRGVAGAEVERSVAADYA